jgi:microsomal dipeptidase-like Zn-dependent dipeptidase
MTYAQDTTKDEDDTETTSSGIGSPTVALLTAGAIGFAVGAVIWQYRRSHPSRFGSFDRAVDMARSGAVDTMHKLQSRLREEGYSPAQIEGRAKKYLSQLIDAAQRRF